MEKNEMKIETWYYITFEEQNIDMGHYIIHGDQYKMPRNLICKRIRRDFKNKEEKHQYRLKLFNSIRGHAHYGKWFADGERKGVIFGNMYEFIYEFIENSLDLTSGSIFVAIRNFNLNGSWDHINKKNRGYLDEILSVWMSMIRTYEEGIVDLPSNATPEKYQNFLDKAYKDFLSNVK